MYLVIMYDAGWHEVSYEKCSSHEEAKAILEKHLDENVHNCGDIAIL